MSGLDNDDWYRSLSSLLPNLQRLSLSNCSISRPMDASLTNLHSLSELDLGFNNLSSTLQDLLGKLPSLRVLWLYSTELYDLSHNHFNDILDDDDDDLSHNTNYKLFGKIPTSSPCTAGTNLDVLDLSYNKLSGVIPAKCFGRLIGNPSVVNLERNNLHGPIPDAYTRGGCKLQMFKLNGNRLQGKLPKSLANCTDMEELDVGNNQLSGTFPFWLQSLPQLRVLVLRSNKFYGPIIRQRSKVDDGSDHPFPMLHVLDISVNNFTVKLPLEYICQWKSMVVTDVHQLAGYVLSIFPININAILLLLWCNNCMSLLVNSQSRGGSSNGIDRLALLAFKVRITNDPFQVVSSWNDSVHYCKWPGVTCGGRRHPDRVRALRLPSKRLVGSLAPEIGNLSFLRKISLYNNNFNGEIPREIEGSYPTFLWNLSSLEIISGDTNDLSGSIPDSFGQLTRFNYLLLGGNKLSGTIPPTIYNLSLLGNFDVSANQLQGSFPPNLGFTLPNLWRLSVAENQFHGTIPISLSNLLELEELYISINSLTGKVAINFGGLSKLTRLSLGTNHLGNGDVDDLNFVNTLTNCSSLELLDFMDNRFGGVLPNSIANVSNQLTRFYVSYNQISGEIPVGIGNLVRLQVLGLSDNLLEGSIPTSIGRLQMLHKLLSYGNRFTGPIPSSLGNLTALIGLHLGDNRLEGKIPSSLGKCKYLFGLILSGNRFNGIIPKDIFHLFTLVELNLSRNSFIGSLPLEVGGLTNLQSLDISENMLFGDIPSTLGACTSLEYLFMEENSFQGSIPSSLSFLRGLQMLDLSHNNLSGFIPKYLGTFKFLQNLNLSFNQLEGELSVDGVFQNSSAVSVIGNNKLCGGIPKLHLRACQTQKSKKEGRSHVFKLIVIICGCGGSMCLIFMISFFIFYKIKKEKKESTLFSIEGRHFKISYAKLLKAIDGFSSTNLIGVGSFGSVYKRVLNDGETIVAVKVLNSRQRGAFKSFMVECESVRNIWHRNLVRILTSCSSIDYEGNDFKALLYEFMSNGNLERWLHPHTNGIQDEQRHLNLVQRLNIAIDMATTLDYLHHHCHTQIVHCDLKPSNILLDGNLTAHLGDFGISRILSKATSSSQNHTSSIGIKGSIGYIAPGNVLLLLI
ncbi:probable LRR receptor-like serine/threonine-protein kinase At3g47570 [Telopea speciosissima]|uniref:probable LRR receptor-like serine/threonine-protein kinase At3g47570 n=1 Tax=Telopea speciosissima TaxID=54955 RepID=UPI001CC815DE|nr:probable LRR receptor-like serine/threonine-protein kinase At3g47570 [Telopea speciosissima]